jgi:uncharacterized RDD family membrane protein YckC
MADIFTITDSNTGQTIEYQTVPICTFGKRVLALLLDVIILAAIGGALGCFLGKQFVQMGQSARLVGFVTVNLYFGIFNSRIGNGQSLGKLIVHIKVVNRAGAYITLPISFLRTLVLVAPLFLNTQLSSPSVLTMLIYSFLSVIGLCMAVATIYLYLFNRNTRQSLHDLICGTYVVRQNLEGPVYTEKVSKSHYIVLIIIAVIGLSLPFVFISMVPKVSLRRLINLQEKLTTLHQVSSTYVSEGVISSSGKFSKYIGVTVFLRNPTDSEDVAKNTAKIILSVPEFARKDLIRVLTTYGYDIGIWSYYNRRDFTQTPKEWMEQVK